MGRFYWWSGGSPTSLLARALHAGYAVEIVSLVGRHHEARGMHERPVAQAFLSGGSDVSDVRPPSPSVARRRQLAQTSHALRRNLRPRSRSTSPGQAPATLAPSTQAALSARGFYVGLDVEYGCTVQHVQPPHVDIRVYDPEHLHH